MTAYLYLGIAHRPASENILVNWYKTGQTGCKIETWFSENQHTWCVFAIEKSLSLRNMGRSQEWPVFRVSVDYIEYVPGFLI